jgi:hypothetical protein
MVDQAGVSASAVAMTQDALSARQGTVAEADRTLTATLNDAHHVAVEALRQLDTIESQIESAVARQGRLALDTPEGAREFHRFLLAKQRDIAAVVAGAQAHVATKVIELQALLSDYRAESATADA